jgi:beta-mannosidase
MDLSGLWRGAELSPELDRSGADLDLDDSDWQQVPVPGHWGRTPAFADATGPIMHRRRFTAEPPAAGQRAWLRFDGIFSDADVWLDGRHLGDVQIYFASHRFDVTGQLGAGSDLPGGEHVLAVDVSCAAADPGAKRSIIGSIQSGPLAPPGSPGGIWRGVGIDTTGPIAILRARLLCTKADEHEAVLQFRVVLDAAEAGEVRIDTSIVGPDGSTAGGVAVHDVASGENHIEWTSRIARPQLWWPAALGDQPRYDVGIAVRTAGNALSDRRHWRTGLRTASVDELQWRVNGQRLFVKGVAVGPHSRFLASVEPQQFVDDVRAVRDAGLNLIRVHGHVSRPELYEAADDLGVLVWQDLPLVGTYATGTQSVARAAARAAVDELGHHPSIVVWCGHDEPNGPPLPEPEGGFEPISRIGRRLSRHLLPSWNRSVLDPLVRRELRAADTSRSVITRSGNLPSPMDLTRSDSHLWLGWHVGRPEDLAELLRRWPRLGMFLGTLGAQSVGVRDWPPDAPTWPTAERGAFGRYVPRAAYSDGESWAHATRAYQADVIRSQIETVRRLKYNPSGGFCVVSLFDAEASGGFGVLDTERCPKPAFNALIDACRPVVVIADPPPTIVTPNQELSLAVHAVSDLRHDLRAVRVKARAHLDEWVSERHWEGPLPADSCTFIGNHVMRVPERTGALVIDLELHGGDQIATNRYRTVVIPPSEAFSQSAARPRT